MTRYDLTHTHRPMVVEIHDHGCECPHCEPPRPSVPPRLDAAALAKLTLAGVAAGHAVAALIWGPAAVLRVLVANLTGTPL